MISSTIIFQSHTSPLPYSWLQACLDSVQAWADLNRYAYRFIGDALFDPVPLNILAKTRSQKVIASDLARLYWVQKFLAEGYQTVVWLDADFLIFNARAFKLPDSQYALGRETWVQFDKNNKLKAYCKVHNAFLMFRSGNSFLDFYTETAEKLVTNNQGSMPPQFVGPKLLSALHNIALCPVMETAGMLSPLVVQDIVRGQGDALTLFKQKSTAPIAGANLCASSRDKQLISDTQMQAAIDSLSTHNPFI